MAELDGQISTKMERRKKCVIFYMKSSSVEQENVKDKLISLINKLDYI